MPYRGSLQDEIDELIKRCVAQVEPREVIIVLTPAERIREHRGHYDQHPIYGDDRTV